jgi:superfamily II DNA/RNA helicase
MADFQVKICEKFNINSWTDNQSKSVMAIIDGKDVFVGTKTGSEKSLTYEAIPKVAQRSKIKPVQGKNESYSR